MAHELALYAQGYRLIAGVDEAGRGALAGDVVAAAVILPVDSTTPERLRGVCDSKQLSARQRSLLYRTIQTEALAIGVGRVSAQEIDRIGIVPATRLAMAEAIANLSIQPDYLLIDAMRLLAIPIAQMAIIHGDARCLSIAAASIVAKVTRDRVMQELDSVFPGYGFAHHKGYGTKSHRHALELLHPCPIHRCTYGPVRALLSTTQQQSHAEPTAPAVQASVTHVDGV